MLYIRFLNLQNPLQDVEQLYKDGTIKPGDIVCQQYNAKYSHLFMNGTWVKAKYTSKIAQNTEVEDDVKTLYDSIVNISTNLSDNYINKTQYLKDEELVASSFADINNKINAQTELIDNISTNLSDNYLTKEQYLKDEKLIARAFIDLDGRINAQTKLLDNNSTNITDISTNIADISTNITDISTNISNISTNLSDNYITKSQYLEDEELIAGTFAELNNKINSQYISINNHSTNIRDISTNLSNISTNLSDNYITKTQYLKDEKLIASTFADVNNKINSLYAEIAELKEQLKSSTK